ncbi:hypothetical protein G9A89_011985 [Geosiphon pyriformis]|nr:hypothetical protein G9A89_011985 [Geosiphon pyriformis]
MRLEDRATRRFNHLSDLATCWASYGELLRAKHSRNKFSYFGPQFPRFPGYEAIAEYLDSRPSEKWSYEEFLQIYHDIILVKPPFNDDFSGNDNHVSTRLGALNFYLIIIGCVTHIERSRAYWNKLILKCEEVGVNRIQIRRLGLITRSIANR